MPDTAARLAELAGTALKGLDYSGSSWEREMKAIIARAHTASFLAATAERLGVKMPSPLLSEARLSRAERQDIKKAVAAQLEYLKGFVKDAASMSEQARAARAQLYAGSVKPAYYAARWGDWDVPQGLLPGMQQCLGNCKCEISIADNGDGTGVLTRTARAEQHCTECPPLAGDHPVKRRGR
jgi:hypothetical protein